jgi:predicted aspartyl protease
MATSKSPFHTKDYAYNKKKRRYEPLLSVLVGSKESKKEVTAWADTGCTPCMHFCKSYIAKEGLTFIKKISTSPHPFKVADGHIVNADLYLAICEIGGEEKEIVVSVTDPEKFFEEEETEIETVMPLIGLGVFNEYDVMFKGKDRKIAIFHPE